MTKLEIVSDYPKNLNELKQFEGQDKINNETKELPSIPRTSFIKQSVVLGAVTFIFAFDPSNITLKHQEYFSEIPSNVQVLYDLEKNTDILPEIKKDIESISTLQDSRLERLIDGEEIKEEMEIIANYMVNAKKCYDARRKRFKI